MFLAVAVLLGTLNPNVTNTDSSAPPTKKTELERAAEQFKIETEAMGLRAGQNESVAKSPAANPHGMVACLRIFGTICSMRFRTKSSSVAKVTLSCGAISSGLMSPAH
jgi:hypothetical protein